MLRPLLELRAPGQVTMLGYYARLLSYVARRLLIRG